MRRKLLCSFAREPQATSLRIPAMQQSFAPDRVHLFLAIAAQVSRVFLSKEQVQLIQARVLL
jgi:hypothetical protein